jgi:hypothetical protein
MSMLGGCIVCYEAVISPQQSDAAFQEGVCTQMVSFWMTSVTSPLKAAAWPVLMSVVVGLIDSEVSGCKASTMDMCLARSMAGSSIRRETSRTRSTSLGMWSGSAMQALNGDAT